MMKNIKTQIFLMLVLSLGLQQTACSQEVESEKVINSPSTQEDTTCLYDVKDSVPNEVIILKLEGVSSPICYESDLETFNKIAVQVSQHIEAKDNEKYRLIIPIERSNALKEGLVLASAQNSEWLDFSKNPESSSENDYQVIMSNIFLKGLMYSELQNQFLEQGLNLSYVSLEVTMLDEYIAGHRKCSALMQKKTCNLLEQSKVETLAVLSSGVLWLKVDKGSE